MYEELLVLDILKNPALLAAFIAVVRDLGGYIYTCLEAYKNKTGIPKFSFTQLAVTMGVYETFFIALSAVPSMPTAWIATITVAVDVVRSFRTAFLRSGHDAPPASG